MKKFTSLLAILVTAVVSIVSFTHQPNAEASGDTFRFDARSLTDTALWTKVNVAPYYISSQLDSLCALPSPGSYQEERKSNPHAATFITVYVNPIGRSAMFEKESPVFPIGSVIVKHKQDRTMGHPSLLYTIMRKRNPGYNPSVGDWEFSVVNADGTTVEASGKLENCQGCHIKKPDSDFVFRPYVEFR